MIRFLHMKLVELVGEMIRCTSISIPAGIHGKGCCRPVVVRGDGEGSNLFLHVPAIIASTEEILVISLKAARGDVSCLGTDLTNRACA
jgi:hypothetical protein